MSADAPHILVVDDDTRLRELLKRYLSENGFRVTTARDAAEARMRLSGLVFDLIVLDVMMPGEDGLALTRWLRRVDRAPVLLLTAMGEAEDRIVGLESGADDYLSKPFDPRELVLRINSVLRRAGQGKRAGTLSFGEVSFDAARGELTRAGRPIHLTSTEATLLGVLARSPNMVLSREDLMAEARLSGNARTVDVQVTRLRRKIEPVVGQPRYLHTVRGRGYMLRPD